MNSPFPGMDPYLERHWGDVHATLMVYVRNQLNAQLPGDLQARVEESLSVEIGNGNGEARTIYPDVRVVEDQGGPASVSSPAAVAVAKPLVLVLDDEPRTPRHVEIVDAEHGHVVTAIEVLSPANKLTRRGRKMYRRKQEDYLESEVNLVEIDLIRAGSFVLAVAEDALPEEYEGPYLICIRRAAQPNEVELYRAPLRERLPNIWIPLRPRDEDVVLQLQPLIDACYADGRYSRTDYRRPPSPPLSAADAQWADALLREAGLR